MTFALAALALPLAPHAAPGVPAPAERASA
jgi:hypothetical protein